MERLRAVTDLEIPANRAEQLLLDYFESRRNAQGAIAYPLRVPLEDFGLPERVSLMHEATISITKGRDAANLNDAYAVAWYPEDRSAFPTFNGELIVCAGADGGAPYLELSGTYEPPRGAAGEAFDAALGHLIAQRTAHAFLLDVARGLRAYAGNA